MVSIDNIANVEEDVIDIPLMFLLVEYPKRWNW